MNRLLKWGMGRRERRSERDPVSFVLIASPGVSRHFRFLSDVASYTDVLWAHRAFISPS